MEAPFADLGEQQMERSGAGDEVARFGAVAIALPFLGSFVGLGLQVVGHFGLQDLIEQRFEQLPEGLIMREEALSLIAVYGKLDLMHACTRFR